MTEQELLHSLGKAFGHKIQHQAEFRGETTYTIAASDLREITKFCRGELLFDYLIDITSIDDFGEEPRFEIVYHLYSMPHAVHLRLKLKVPEDAGAVDTVSDIWPTANWHEREIYDMMGIKFNGHPDLRRILMWEWLSRSSRCEKIFRSKDWPAKCPMSLSQKSHLWKAAPSLLFRALPPQKTVNRALGPLNCKFQATFRGYLRRILK